MGLGNPAGFLIILIIWSCSPGAATQVNSHCGFKKEFTRGAAACGTAARLTRPRIFARKKASS